MCLSLLTVLRACMLLPGDRRFAWGHDELNAGSRNSREWFRMGLTIVDSLDTLIITGLLEEYAEARFWVANHLDLNQGDVSVRPGVWTRSPGASSREGLPAGLAAASVAGAVAGVALCRPGEVVAATDRAAEGLVATPKGVAAAARDGGHRRPRALRWPPGQNTPRSPVPSRQVFETTIRILGGLVSAFYQSGGDELFLWKAVDFAERCETAAAPGTPHLPACRHTLAHHQDPHRSCQPAVPRPVRTVHPGKPAAAPSD
jgi:hypothetical protein